MSYPVYSRNQLTMHRIVMKRQEQMDIKVKEELQKENPCRVSQAVDQYRTSSNAFASNQASDQTNKKSMIINKNKINFKNDTAGKQIISREDYLKQLRAKSASLKKRSQPHRKLVPAALTQTTNLGLQLANQSGHNATVSERK